LRAKYPSTSEENGVSVIADAACGTFALFVGLDEASLKR
jgi:hypothetical protein